MNEPVNIPEILTSELDELQRLRQREALFEATERLAKIGHYQWDRQNDCLESCSEEYANILNINIDDAKSSLSSFKNFLSFVHPEDHQHYKISFEDLSTKKSLDLKYRIVLNTGELKYVHEIGITSEDDQGIEVGYFGLLKDITSQHIYEHNLEFRDDISRQAESITDIGHFIFDEVNEMYQHVSEGFARIYGTNVDDFLTRITSVKDDLSYIHEQDRTRVYEEYQHSMAAMDDCAIEYRIYRFDGEIRWIRELSKAYRVQDGRTTQTLGVIQDITERINYEQELVFKNSITNEAESLTGIGYFLYDEIADKNLYTSQGQARLLGLSVDEYNEKARTTQCYLNYVHEEDRENLKNIYAKNLADFQDWKVDYRLWRSDGELRWVREFGKAFRISNGRVEQTIGVVQDITDQKKNEKDLMIKDAIAGQVEAITDIGHFIYDEIANKYLHVSPGMAKTHGVEANELIRRITSKEADLARMHADDREKVKKVYDEFMAKGGEWHIEYRLVRDDGSIRWIREMGTVYLEQHGIPEQTIGVQQDITEQKEAEQAIIESRDLLEQQVVERTYELANTIRQLRDEIEERKKITATLDFLANHDALTELPSLRLCKDRLNRSIAEAQRNKQLVAVMFLDIDGFKIINDTFGHEFGDQVLKVTAGRILEEIRETDTVARVGGDEFVVILTSLPDLSIAERIASSLIAQIAQHISLHQKSVTVSASIGIALYPNNALTADDLIRVADNAMYQIKHSGKNNFVFADTSATP